MKIRLRLLPMVALMALLAACGGAESSGSAESADSAAAASGPWPPQPTGPVDAELAARGEQLFQAKGCVACHKIGGGRLVGPDLAGITERRTYGWTMAMITNPDSMLRTDSIAKRLLSEYFTPMSNQGVTPEESRALWEYFRAEGSGAGSTAEEQ